MTVCILVKCTNNGEKMLSDVNIYEIVPDSIAIANCSYPIKTSSFDEILRCERNGARILCAKDISSSEKFLKILLCNDTISCYLLKNNLTLTNSTPIDENISLELNKIIYCDYLYNQTQLFDLNSSNFLGDPTKKLLKLARNNKTQKDDNILLNFLLLRDSYSSYILKPDRFLEIQENKRVYRDTGFIHIKIPVMRPKDTVIFRYYVLISDYGIYRTNTKIDLSGGKYANYQVPLDIEFMAPKFNVQVALTKLDFISGDLIHINYIADLLNPEDISADYMFNAIVETNNNDLSFENDKNQLNFSFSNGDRSCSNLVNITINRSGDYSIPQLHIGGGQYFVIDKSIKVEEFWHKYILEITLIILSICTLFGSSINWMRREKLPIVIFLTISFASLSALVLSFKLSLIALVVLLLLFVPLISYYLLGLKKLN